MPPALPDLEPSYYGLGDEPGCSSSGSSSASGNEKLEEIPLQNWNDYAEPRKIRELCLLCSQLSLMHEGHRRFEHNETMNIDNYVIEKLCASCGQLTL